MVSVCVFVVLSLSRTFRVQRVDEIVGRNQTKMKRADLENRHVTLYELSIILFSLWIFNFRCDVIMNRSLKVLKPTRHLKKRHPNRTP